MHTRSKESPNLASRTADHRRRPARLNQPRVEVAVFPLGLRFDLRQPLVVARLLE
jgi:hypothetical protein